MRRHALAVAGLMLVLAACGSSTADEDRNIAFPVGLFSKQANAITVGNRHTCAITTKGVVECWGNNEYGQLGSAEPAFSTSPVVVPGLPADRKAVRLSQGAMSNHTCAILDNADLWCWGSNGATQSATRGPRSDSVPAARIAINVIDVATNFGSTCLVKRGGTIQCWGNNGASPLGWDGRFGRDAAVTYDEVKALALETNGGRAVDIEAGTGHFCALFDDQTVDCWGQNDLSQSGQDPGRVSIDEPTLIPGLTNVTDIALGDAHSCAITFENRILCWGSGDVGILGGVHPDANPVPVVVEFPPAPLGGTLPPPQLKSIFAGWYNTCVVDETNMAKCWGPPNNGLWGTNVVEAPRYVTAVLGTEDFAAGAVGQHFCTVNTYGLPRCHGWNRFGQLGIGTLSDRVGTATAVKTYSAANTKVQLPGVGLVNVDFGLIGGGTAAGVVAGQQPAQPAVDPAPAADPSAQPIEVVDTTTVPGAPTVAESTTTTIAGSATTATGATAKAALPRLKVRRTARTGTLARWASLRVPKGAKVTFTIARASKRLCARNAGKLQGVRAGVCTVTVKVAKKGTRTQTKKISIRVVR